MINLKKFSDNVTYRYTQELIKQDTSILGNFVPVESFDEMSNGSMQPHNISNDIYLNSGFTSHTKQNSAFSPTSSSL